jgi:hypothetical protein
MTLITNLRARLLRSCGVLCLVVCAGNGAPVLYTFTATTRSTMGSPAHLEQFKLDLPDFLPLVMDGTVIPFQSDDPAVISCIACANPPTGALLFLRSSTGDIIQFRDADGILRPYFFSPSALSSVGTYSTLPGINVNVGSLAVSQIPEPSTAGLVGVALAAALHRWRRKRSRVPVI